MVGEAVSGGAAMDGIYSCGLLGQGQGRDVASSASTGRCVRRSRSPGSVQVALAGAADGHGPDGVQATEVEPVSPAPLPSEVAVRAIETSFRVLVQVWSRFSGLR
ncbi:hypothetical protein GCM10010319_24900 [Streptomyces blastmyceticus]|uniref:Uncharacterized protein n=1 Tax=Streptomyces blastmyceticus TaxID=68180 RepID=A0ABN0WW19_9ACTN